MAAKSRRKDPALKDLLFAEPYRFGFFQAVRILERLAPERAPVGHSSLPTREAVRFRSRTALSFPASEVYELHADKSAEATAPPDMIINFMGMIGPLGVLPNAFTELVMDRVRYRDTALWSFMDMFSHRMVSFFYRAWEKCNFPIAYERGDHDRFTEFLFDIVGMGTVGLRPGRLHLHDQALIYYGGQIAQQPHSASSIGAVLGDHFGTKAEVKQFFGQWLKLDLESLSYVGKTNSQLGVNTVAGTKVWDDQSKFRIRFGPMPFDKFKAFLPNGPAFAPATAFIRFLAGMEFDYDVQLVLAAKEVPSTILTTRARRKPMLGWTSWLKTAPLTEDDDQVVLQVNN